ncbi:hypothetical protein T4A_1480 [Trichinella pseudospiralis]|uniref:Uncharacterized protein n=1 Tax=Trichinella pseudospiralis TaxID=6337 RepID=A0A0V1ESE6_TRIPS|nr:hypothetical protein T4A_1480 [Trichinella pseudospiralis]
MIIANDKSSKDELSINENIEMKLCFIKLIANLCSEQFNIRRNTPSPVEIHSPPHRLSTTPEDLNYATYAITYEFVNNFLIILYTKNAHKINVCPRIQYRYNEKNNEQN